MLTCFQKKINTLILFTFFQKSQNLSRDQGFGIKKLEKYNKDKKL